MDTDKLVRSPVKENYGKAGGLSNNSHLLRTFLKVLVTVLIFVWVFQSQITPVSAHGHSHDHHEHSHDHHGHAHDHGHSHDEPPSFKYSKQANEQVSDFNTWK